jgi:ribonuclease P protein component
MDCFNKGKRVHGTYSTIIFSPTDTFQCAVVVGKKVSKKAVTRNAFRRSSYGVVERLIKDRQVTGAYIFVLKPVVVGVSRVALRVALEAEFGRVLN